MSGPFGSSQWMYASGEAESQSLRFNDNDSAYLSWTPSTAGDRQKFTWSGWIKRGNLSSSTSDIKALIGSYNSSANRDVFRITDDNGKDILSFQVVNGGITKTVYTTAVFRDVSAWYHIVLSVDTTQATAADRVNIYVNGEAQTLSGSYPTQNTNTHIANIVAQYLGARSISGSATNFFDGCMSEVNFVDGTALDPTSFGETDANGQWVPIISPSVTYGTNGYYLPFLNGIGDDESGNSNDWTANNIATTDLMLDSPLNNFSTMNPLASSATLSEGNLRSQYSGSGTYQSAASTMSISSGKWYVELRVTIASTYYPGFGIADITTSVASDPNHTSYLGKTSNGIAYYTNNGFFTNDAIDQSSTVTVSSGDIIGIAIDLDSAQNTYKIYQNGTLAETYNINAPANAYAFCESTLGTASAARADWNFGSDSSFHGLETAQGNQDGNGKGDFYYEPPSGYLALCTDNLPDPDIADGSEHFNTVLYTGNGGTQSVTGVGFEPSLTWVKDRSAANSHWLNDEVRGAGLSLASNTNEEEKSYAAYFTSFDSDGFSLAGGTGGFNANSDTYVAWNWKADNTSGASNTNGSITSTVSANTTAGFSVVGYTGTGAVATVGHGLGVAPDMIIVKNRDGATNWRVYHSAEGATEYASLNASDAFASATSVWNDTDPTSSVFTVGASTTTNPSGSDLIAYCFHSVEFYSKFGFYTGNGSADGPFVYTGFRPAFVMLKRTDSTANWTIIDNTRSTHNVVNKALFPDTNIAEQEGTSSGYTMLDFLSNGFKYRQNTASHNASGGTYIYMAFAENPFKYSNAR